MVIWSSESDTDLVWWDTFTVFCRYCSLYHDMNFICLQFWMSSFYVHISNCFQWIRSYKKVMGSIYIDVFICKDSFLHSFQLKFYNNQGKYNKVINFSFILYSRFHCFGMQIRDLKMRFILPKVTNSAWRLTSLWLLSFTM